MPRLAIASTARADLREIRRASKALFGAARAYTYLTGLGIQFDAALHRPLAGRAERDLGPGLRSIGFGSHRIYYDVAGGDVTIVRILHHRQSVDDAFGLPE